MGSFFDDTSVLRFALLSGLIGFAVFCVSYAVQVWRRRNKSLKSKEPFSVLQSLKRFCFLAASLGILGIFVSLAIREVVRPAGLLEGNELVTIRAREDFDLEYLHAGDTIRPGETLARFHDPNHAAKIAKLKLQRSGLLAEKDSLQLKPLMLDNDLVRQLQNVIAKEQQLQIAMTQLLPEHYATLRAGAVSNLSRKEELVRLESKILQWKAELELGKAKHKFHAGKLQRVLKLGKQAVSTEEIETQQQMVDLHALEMAKLQKDIESFQQEQKQLEQGLANFDELTGQQAQELKDEIKNLQNELTLVREQEKDVRKKYEKELVRAEQFRAEEIRQIDLKIEECAAELTGLTGTVTLVAPHAGQIWFRAPAPKSIHKQGPVLVLGPEQGARVKIRLPASQLEALAQAGDVLLRLTGPRFPQRFKGSFHRAKALPQEPDYVLAELWCVPPEETIPLLADREEVTCEMLWRPPLSTLWTFQMSLFLAAAGAMGWLICLAVLAGRRSSSVQADEEAATVTMPGHVPFLSSVSNLSHAAHGNSSSHDLEYGSSGAMLHLLGAQLREAILRQELDPALLGAVEWALDRHQVRAVRLLSAALKEDADLAKQIRELYQRQDSQNFPHQEKCFQRLHAILKALVPEAILVNYFYAGDELAG
jgi:hypothetical protein